MSLTRRDFIGGAASAAVMCGVGGVSVAFAGNENLLRPPGGQTESHFIGECIKCDRCRSVCPEHCIGLAGIEDGLLKARSPKMDFHRGSCTFCDRCIQVCPTGALGEFDESHEKIGVAVLNTSRCVAWKNPGSCIKCEQACEYDAVEIVDGVPQVHEDRCNGCGACEYKCPALVLLSLSEGEDRGIVVRKVGSTSSSSTSQGAIA